MNEIMNEAKLNKLNDTMTMVTLEKTITISAADYREMIEAKTKYETLIDMICQSLTILNESPLIDKVVLSNKMTEALPVFIRALEPEAFNWAAQRLRKAAEA